MNVHDITLKEYSCLIIIHQGSIWRARENRARDLHFPLWLNFI